MNTERKDSIMAKRKYDNEPKVVKKGFNYYCYKCVESFRWASLKDKKTDLYIMKVCPNCGEMVTDLKKK